MMTHIGFTGTRWGMSPKQIDRVSDILSQHAHDEAFAHHGCCVGADEDFARLADEQGVHIIGHPGPTGKWTSRTALGLCDEIHQPEPYMKRNRAIVEASSAVIATPFQDDPQPSGGTWRTIYMAIDGFRNGRPMSLYVVGRDGKLLDHTKWGRP